MSSSLRTFYSWIGPVVVFLSVPQCQATILGDAIVSGKPLSLNRCLAAAASDINLNAVSTVCHEDIQRFYCRRVRDVASKRYTERFVSGCVAGGDKDPELVFRPFHRATIAYVILAHQFPENVKRLVSRLFVPLGTIFAVHIDEKNPSMFNELSIWVVEEGLDYAVQIFSELNIVRGGPNMLHAELLGIRRLLNHTIPWDFCILLSEQDYPLRGNAVLAEYLWVHRGTSFVSVDEGECERDVSYQCGDRVVSLSGGVQYPKIPGMRYASGSQWFAITYQLAAVIGTHLSNSSTIVGTILHDLITVKQPDESFFQAVVLNSEFCSRYSDYTLHWTDKDSMREVRSLTSEYNIMSPGVLIFPRDVAKVSEVRDKSLWAFFARKFDNSLQSTQLKDSLDKLSKQNSRKVWTRVQKHQVPALWRSLASDSSDF